MITAGSTAPIEFAYQIFKKLDVYSDEALEAWFGLFKTGDSVLVNAQVPDGDCNNNGIGDSVDISGGASLDANLNGIPDECEPQTCTGDVTGNGSVNLDDLLAVINAWGATGPNPADVTGNGVVNVDDLLAVINAWGPCE